MGSLRDGANWQIGKHQNRRDEILYHIMASSHQKIELFLDLKTMDGAVAKLAEWESNESENPPTVGGGVIDDIDAHHTRIPMFNCHILVCIPMLIQASSLL